MHSNTEQALISQLANLNNISQLCNGVYPNTKLSLCATTALKYFIGFYICKNTGTHSPKNKNYNYLIDLLNMINNNVLLLNSSDNAIWRQYRHNNPQAPKSNHQLPGVAKAIMKAGLYP